MKHRLLALLCLFSLCIHAQSYKLFTTDNELSSSLINQIYQDRNGMIWVATEDGLNRYDGSKFTIYKHQPSDSTSLCHNYVRTLFEDSKGHLFIGTYGGLQMYNPETDRFTPPARWEDKNEKGGLFITILERKNGEIWTSGNELCKVTIQKNKLSLQKVQVPVQDITMTSNMIEDKKGAIWVIKDDAVVYRLGPDNQVSLYLSHEENASLNYIYEDPIGNIYVGTIGKGLLKYDEEKDDFFPIAYKGKNNLPVKCLFSGSPNRLYIGTDGQGVKILHVKQREIVDFPFDNKYLNPTTSKVHCILKDNTGNLWLAIYQKGVMMIPASPNSFKYIGYKSDNKNIIGSNCITSLCRDKAGTLWVGTDNDGIYEITPDLRQKRHYIPSDDETSVPTTIFGLYEDSEQNLWFGSYMHGMGRLNRQTGRCTYMHDLLDSKGNKIQRVYNFQEDGDKRLWIATMSSGLFYYDLKAERFVHPDINVQINPWVDCLLYSKDNKLYVGTYNGISCIDLSTDELKTETILPGHIAHTLYEDSKGIIWIGTATGLISWDKKNNQTKTYTTDDGLPSNTIYAIAADEQDNLWISTNAGLSQLHSNRLQFVNYYVGDGLQGNEFSKNASWTDPTGTIWFGGVNGITYFTPQEIVRPAKRWNVRITDFYLHNEPVRKGMLSGGREIIDRAVFEAKDFYLSHRDNSFSIELSTVELNSPERLIYYYAMNGSDWISLPKGNHQVFFHNLPPDTYHFRIKAQDNHVDSEIEEITIHIRPAWWVSWWAKSLYVCLALAIVIGIILQIRHRYRMRQQMLQHIHAEQLNESKLQFFINISHEIRTPMSLIISPLQKLMNSDTDTGRQKSYRTIYRNAERILRLINQLMDIRKIDKGQMSLTFRPVEIIGFIDDLCETFAQQAVQKDITLTFHHKGMEQMELWIDPANFDKIILNILSNAFKFTPERGKVDIYLQTGEDEHTPAPLHRYAEIIIADSGIGIDKKEREHIFERFYQIKNSQNNSNIGTGIGLHLTQSLVGLHHGSIRVDDNPDGAPGTRFIVRLPIGNKHLTAEEMDADSTAPTLHRPTVLNDASAIPVVEEDVKVRAKTKYRILLVDDEEEIRRYVSEELSTQYHVSTCTNGKEALEVIFKRTPDLVISDVMMDEMDGLTLCRKIKQNIHLNHLPVILLTAKTREEDNIEGLETGADAYITKPFNIDLLKTSIDNLIRSREQLKNAFSGRQHQDDKVEKIEAASPDDKLMERIMRVINQNLSNPNLTVEQIAEEVGISRVHLHRKLKELTNQSTRDFIRNTRLKQAAALLSEKRYAIAEVAALTGFPNADNFSTAFKALYGVSPKKYMEDHLNCQ
ncbi:MAG: two-component regulator propeller domain-containing protein [Bacteroides sp.]|nr:two-component regulator propeller domain-containing protein [Bacteroides sp.]